MNQLRDPRGFSYARARAFLALIFLLTASACATQNAAQQDAFKALKTIRVSVEASLTVFNAGYQAGTYTEAQRAQLRTLYSKYLAADKIAAESLGVTLTTDPTVIVSQVTVLAGDVIKFVQSLKGAP